MHSNEILPEDLIEELDRRDHAASHDWGDEDFGIYYAGSQNAEREKPELPSLETAASSHPVRRDHAEGFDWNEGAAPERRSSYERERTAFAGRAAMFGAASDRQESAIGVARQKVDAHAYASRHHAYGPGVEHDNAIKPEWGLVAKLKVRWAGVKPPAGERPRIERESKESLAFSLGVLAKGLNTDITPVQGALKKVLLYGTSSTERDEFGIRHRSKVNRALTTVFRAKKARMDDAAGTYSGIDKELTAVVEDGRADTSSTMTHEAMHAFMKSVGVTAPMAASAANPEKAGVMLVDEGLGALGDILHKEAVSGRVAPLPAAQFRVLRAELEDGESVAHRIYDGSNAWTLRYLIAERGGVEKLREVTQSMPKLRPKEKHVIEGYEKVYGEPLSELVLKAEAWYEDRMARNAILGNK